MKRALVVGLGNPGLTYRETRHNLGFKALDALADKRHLPFHKKSAWKGLVAEGEIETSFVTLLKPLTFMNLSGLSIRAAMHSLKLDLPRLIVIVDDAAIPFGKIRLRPSGSSGGHNGLKSVEEHLQTDQYARLRIGIGEPLDEDLESYVLSQFTKDEKELLPDILAKAVQTVELWLGHTSAMELL